MISKLHDPMRVLMSATSIALGALLLVIPATGTPQSEAGKSGAQPFNDNVDDPAEWGKAFPAHYDHYRMSVDMRRKGQQTRATLGNYLDMLCGGEPLVVPHFLALAEKLGRAGVRLKIESNGQRFDAAVAERLARLPIRSVQISLDGDTEETYGRQRPGGSLAKAHAACRAARGAGLPLEITFAPTRINIHEASPVIERARALDAFRFNTGKLMMPTPS